MSTKKKKTPAEVYTPAQIARMHMMSIMDASEKVKATPAAMDSNVKAAKVGLIEQSYEFYLADQERRNGFDNPRSNEAKAASGLQISVTAFCAAKLFQAINPWGRADSTAAPTPQVATA